MKFEQVKNEPELHAAKEVLREAFETLLSNKKELANLARYMITRPIRSMLEGGPKERMEKDSSAIEAVMDFCKKVNVEYPKTVDEIEALIERLSSDEFDEQIKEVLSK